MILEGISQETSDILGILITQNDIGKKKEKDELLPPPPFLKRTGMIKAYQCLPRAICRSIPICFICNEKSKSIYIIFHIKSSYWAGIYCFRIIILSFTFMNQSQIISNRKPKMDFRLWNELKLSKVINFSAFFFNFI